MPVLSQRHGDVIEITLNWPEARNALGPTEGRELRLALEAANADDSLAAIVLTANGKAFCAGGNLPEIVRLAKEGADAVKTAIYGEFQGIFRAIRECRVPLITAVDGGAIGFGCDLALAGSMTFIGKLGWLAQGWIKAGLVPATGGTQYVMRRGGQLALWHLLQADKIDGPAAERWGLATSCEDARRAALAMAARLAALPRQPLRAVVHLAKIEEFDKHLQTALDYQTEFLTAPDFAEAAQRLLRR